MTTINGDWSMTKLKKQTNTGHVENCDSNDNTH